MCLRVCLCECVRVCACVSVCMCVYVCVCVRMCACVCACVRVSACVCVSQGLCECPLDPSLKTICIHDKTPDPWCEESTRNSDVRAKFSRERRRNASMCSSEICRKCVLFVMAHSADVDQERRGCRRGKAQLPCNVVLVQSAQFALLGTSHTINSRCHDATSPGEHIQISWFEFCSREP